MIKALARIKQSMVAKRLQNAKDRILKQREPILDAFSENIKGARTCALYMGGPCIGGLCEFFRKYETVPDGGGKIKEYYRCSINQTPALLVELLDLTRLTNSLLIRLVAIFEQTAKKEEENK